MGPKGDIGAKGDKGELGPPGEGMVGCWCSRGASGTGSVPLHLLTAPWGGSARRHPCTPGVASHFQVRKDRDAMGEGGPGRPRCT